MCYTQNSSVKAKDELQAEMRPDIDFQSARGWNAKK